MRRFITPIVIILIFLVLQLALFAVGSFVNADLEDAPNFKPPLKEKLSPALKNLADKQLTVTWGEGQKSYLDIKDFTVEYARQYSQEKSLRINFDKLENMLLDLAPAINQPPTNAKLEFADEQNRLKEFSLPQDGQKLNIEKSAAQIAKAVAEEKTEAGLAIDKIRPDITLRTIERLGINTLLARGESDFKGSSASRIHNIKVGSAKFHGLLLKPDEEFSFNSILGEIEGRTGYQHELVIKGGKLIPEYGGGLCQVSTTMFRAAILAGLPILERRPHSIQVRYYNPQGFDATIYPGITDLRFVNDTGNNILVQSRVEGTKLFFELYGSSDGRKVEVIGPEIVEQKANGSLKTVLTRKITFADGKEKEDLFKSDYKSSGFYPLLRNPLE